MKKISDISRYWVQAERKSELAPFDSSRPLVFMHIPKTSGTAITNGLREALAPAVTVNGFDHSVINRKYLDTMQESISRHVYASPLSMPRSADFVSGHFAVSTLIKAYPSAQRITVLREPATRVLSHWLYWRQHTDEDMKPWGDNANLGKIARESLEIFLNAPMLAFQIDNLMLRMLLWPHPLIRQDQFIDQIYDRQLLREAMRRLAEFHFVDCIENDAFLDRISCWLGRPFRYTRLNETLPIPEIYRSPLHQELTPKAHDLLCARSRLDRSLWAKVIGRRRTISDVESLRAHTLVANVSRYSLLMAC